MPGAEGGMAHFLRLRAIEDGLGAGTSQAPTGAVPAIVTGLMDEK